jgi:hypothetical protein
MHRPFVPKDTYRFVRTFASANIRDSLFDLRKIARNGRKSRGGAFTTFAPLNSVKGERQSAKRNKSSKCNIDNIIFRRFFNADAF